MDVKGINSGIVVPKKEETKEQKAVKRVQTEFLKQISQGKTEKEALLSSLKAIDEKYNPKEDSLELSTDVQNCKLGTACCLKSFKMPSASTVGKWLGIIAEITPLLMKILNILFPDKGGSKADAPMNAVA